MLVLCCLATSKFCFTLVKFSNLTFMSASNELIKANCLCLGPTGSGKTLLLKKLQARLVVDETSSTVPTIGTDIITIKIPSDGQAKQSNIIIREIGGVMAPMWNKYYEGVNKVMFVIDTSNLCQIAAAGILLYTILTEPQLQNAKILMVLTKMDASYRQMRNEAMLMLQTKRLREEVPQSIIIVEASAVDGDGTETILKWLQGKEIKDTFTKNH